MPITKSVGVEVSVTINLDTEDGQIKCILTWEEAKSVYEQLHQLLGDKKVQTPIPTQPLFRQGDYPRNINEITCGGKL